MKTDFGTTAILLFTLLLTGQSVSAATLSGSTALALAALVGAQSPVLSSDDKSVLARLLDGHTSDPFPANKRISVQADEIACSAGDIDITMHSCTLSFGANLTGRTAHELYATMVEAGVPSDGTAGQVHEGLSHLMCTIDPNEVVQEDGGGADCTFDAMRPPAAKSKP